MRQPSRRGFTTIELLVVIAIILVLMGLTLSAVMYFAGNAGQTRATQVTLRDAKSRMDSQWRAVRDKATRESTPQAENALAQIAAALGTTLNDPNVRNTYVQLRLQQVFPQNFYEALNSPTANGQSISALTPPTAYKTYLARYGITTGAQGSQDYAEPAICLLMALTAGEGTTSNVSADDFGPGVKTVTTASGAQAPGFVDGWGRPILFTRSVDATYVNLAASQGGTPNQQAGAVVIMSTGRNGDRGPCVSLPNLAVTNAGIANKSISTLTSP